MGRSLRGAALIASALAFTDCIYPRASAEEVLQTEGWTETYPVDFATVQRLIPQAANACNWSSVEVDGKPANTWTYDVTGGLTGFGMWLRVSAEKLDAEHTVVTVAARLKNRISVHDSWHDVERRFHAELTQGIVRARGDALWPKAAAAASAPAAPSQ